MNIYIYGLTRNSVPLDKPLRGLDNALVYLIKDQKVAALVSKIKKETIAVEEGNLMAHHLVLEKSLDIFPAILPMRFGMMVKNEKIIKKNFLQPNEKEIVEMLKKTKGKIEISLQAFWKNVQAPLSEIIKSNPQLASLQKELLENNLNLMATVSVGKMVEEELVRKKQQLKELIIENLTPLSVQYADNPVNRKEAILNTAFLIDKNQYHKFEEALREIDKRNKKEQIDFTYSPPLPPYDFVNASFGLT